MRLFCPPELIEEIILVDNSSPGASRNWHNDMLWQFGDLANLVRIVPAEEVGWIPTGTHGWFSQQILKISVSEIIRSDRYLVLDAKNHLTAPLNRSFLESSSGQPLLNGISYINHPMQEFLERTLAYLELDPKAHMNWFTRTDTPFTMLANECRELMRRVTLKENRPFASVFLDRKLSEFFLYAGFLVSKGTLWQMYQRTEEREPQVWPENANVESCAAAIRKAARTGSPFMTIHRRAMARLDDEARNQIAVFWHSRGLFASVKNGVRFLNDPNRAYQHCDGSVVAFPFSVIASRLRPHRDVSQGKAIDRVQDRRSRRHRTILFPK